MEKQYLAQFRNGFCAQDEWLNAKTFFTFKEGRYCKTLEEAQQCLDKVIKNGQKYAIQEHVLGTPPFSIASGPDQRNLVVETRIKVREVTEWEEV